MNRYPNESVARFDSQFAESQSERNDRLRANRDNRLADRLLVLIADLSACLADEGPDFSEDGLLQMRRRVANALPPDQCPEWLAKFRDPPVVQS